MKFLRFDFESSARVVMAPWIEDGAWPAYIGTAAVDVVGTIHRPTGNMLDDDLPEMVELEGFHINLSESVPDLAAYEIERPSNPAQVFFGDPG